jgi:hypothetical protein
MLLVKATPIATKKLEQLSVDLTKEAKVIF